MNKSDIFQKTGILFSSNNMPSTKMSGDVTIVERDIHSFGGWSLQPIYIKTLK